MCIAQVTPFPVSTYRAVRPSLPYHVVIKGLYIELGLSTAPHLVSVIELSTDLAELSTELSTGGSMHRRPVNKGKSAGQFRRNISRTKAANVRTGPARGGIRL